MLTSALSSIYTQYGQGWLHDILEIGVFFDSELEVRAPFPRTLRDSSGRLVSSDYEPLFVSGSVVRGFIRISAPVGRSVPHEGIVARLESGFFTLNDVNTRTPYAEIVEVCPPGTIEGIVDLPFSFPGTGRAALYESYEGDLFSIRHSVSVTAARPWFTFEVNSSAPFSVQRVHDVSRPADSSSSHRLPAAAASSTEGSSSAPAAATTASTLDAQLAQYGEQELALDEVEPGSSVIFTYDKGW